MAKEIESAMKPNYSTKTEFIRDAVRNKLEKMKLKEAMLQIAHLKGASNKKTSDKELHKIREQVFNKLEK